jgi:hypothetical protein
MECRCRTGRLLRIGRVLVASPADKPFNCVLPVKIRYMTLGSRHRSLAQASHKTSDPLSFSTRLQGCRKKPYPYRKVVGPLRHFTSCLPSSTVFFFWMKLRTCSGLHPFFSVEFPFSRCLDYAFKTLTSFKTIHDHPSQNYGIRKHKVQA